MKPMKKHKFSSSQSHFRCVRTSDAFQQFPVCPGFNTRLWKPSLLTPSISYFCQFRLVKCLTSMFQSGQGIQDSRVAKHPPHLEHVLIREMRSSRPSRRMAMLRHGPTRALLAFACTQVSNTEVQKHSTLVRSDQFRMWLLQSMYGVALAPFLPKPFLGQEVFTSRLQGSMHSTLEFCQPVCAGQLDCAAPQVHLRHTLSSYATPLRTP